MLHRIKQGLLLLVASVVALAIAFTLGPQLYMVHPAVGTIAGIGSFAGSSLFLTWAIIIVAVGYD